MEKKKVIIGISIGVISSTLLGFLFISVIPLIQPPKYLMFWLMLIIGSFIACIWFNLPNPAGISTDLQFAVVHGGGTFGVESMVITFLAGEYILAFLPLVLCIVGFLLAGYFIGESGTMWLWGLGLLTVSGFILGIIYGGTLAIIGLLIILATVITALIRNI